MHEQRSHLLILRVVALDLPHDVVLTVSGQVRSLQESGGQGYLIDAVARQLLRHVESSLELQEVREQRHPLLPLVRLEHVDRTLACALVWSAVPLRQHHQHGLQAIWCTRLCRGVIGGWDLSLATVC